VALAASVALYLGVGLAVPLVDWGDDRAEFLRAEGVRDVRIASVFPGLAGVLPLAVRSWWAGSTAVVAAVLLTVLAEARTVASWGLLLLYVLALAGGCGGAAGRILRRRGTTWSPQGRERRRSASRHSERRCRTAWRRSWLRSHPGCGSPAPSAVPSAAVRRGTSR
jgi:hypothetical protein